jgi:hypothetical protein
LTTNLPIWIRWKLARVQISFVREEAHFDAGMQYAALNQSYSLVAKGTHRPFADWCLLPTHRLVVASLGLGNDQI